MTKTQAKKRLTPLMAEIGSLRAKIKELGEEMQKTADAVKPYEGNRHLTDEQYRRQEWFDDIAYQLRYIADEMDERSHLIEETL